MTEPSLLPSLVLGPLVRHVDETSAVVWVETSAAGLVTVRAGERSGSAGTFGVHGRHYAVVDVDGLEPGSRTPYVVEVDGHRVWPEPGSAYPDSLLATLDLARPLRLAFGSCRVSVPHDAEHHAAYGVDAMRAVGLGLAGVVGDRGAPDAGWPHLLLLLGDQVYADETSEEMREIIRRRRDPEQPPWWELRDYEEYAELYRLAWSDPGTRWLLSTLPSAMIFDDHDIRDDWNTSASWLRDMRAKPWWHLRIVGGLASYWVYQHLGNLSPEERRADPVWRVVRDHGQTPGEPDVTEALEAMVTRADREPGSYRWSFVRDLGPQARLVVVDSRAGRVLDAERRSMLDDDEMAWLDTQLRGDVDHLLVGTSLPFLMAPGFHHAEAVVEVVAQGKLGAPLAWLGERVRRAVDTEHWPAFQEGFARVGEMVVDVAAGRRGRAPSTVTFLSGDVHHSYVAEAHPDPARGVSTQSRLLQAVCSPMRNPLPTPMRWALGVATRGTARPTGRFLGRLVPRSPVHWRVTHGPWFDNSIAMLETDGPALSMWWTTADVVDDDHARPRLRESGRWAG